MTTDTTPSTEIPPLLSFDEARIAFGRELKALLMRYPTAHKASISVDFFAGNRVGLRAAEYAYERDFMRSTTGGKTAFEIAAVRSAGAKRH